MEEAHTQALRRCPPWGRLQGGVIGSLLSQPLCRMLYLHLDLESRYKNRSWTLLRLYTVLMPKGPNQRVVRFFQDIQTWVRWHIRPLVFPVPQGSLAWSISHYFIGSILPPPSVPSLPSLPTTSLLPALLQPQQPLWVVRVFRTQAHPPQGLPNSCSFAWDSDMAPSLPSPNSWLNCHLLRSPSLPTLLKMALLSIPIPPPVLYFYPSIHHLLRDLITHLTTLSSNPPYSIRI